MRRSVDQVILVNMGTLPYKKILITGGAGFVGSHLGIMLKSYYPDISVIALDNLVRRGSELNITRLKKHGISFVHGDVRNKDDLLSHDIDLIIECSAEPSVMAGVSSSPNYLLDTNLGGAINCFELARIKEADIIFLSTSRVYPIKPLTEISLKESSSRFTISEKQSIPGVSKKGISENFPLSGYRSLYGATKLAAELVLEEYRQNYGIKAVIDRFGVISGPWQMGKVDQGVIALWMARHIFKKPLSYIGFGGTGKQVRDVLHIDDVFSALNLQMKHMRSYNDQIYNIGGGSDNSISLFELTNLCQEVSMNKTAIKSLSKTRTGDIPLYITDASTFQEKSGWKPSKSVEDIVTDIHTWILTHQEIVEPIFT